MTDLQRKSFELLQIVVGICEKWEIPYYLVCGSALGAVKYGGFIPWDDDIDVGMLREDYQRFLEIAPTELPEWCFIQNYKTDKLYPQTYSKLRNSNTTFIEKNIAHLPSNHGIFIDLFPIDGYPKGIAARVLFKYRIRINRMIRYSVIKNHPVDNIRFRNRILRIFGVHRLAIQAHEYIEKLYSRYSVRNSELWCNYGNWQGELEFAPQWHYGNGTWGTFEGLRVRIPENYDAYLTQKYGDWRSDPPPEKQKSHHNSVVIDAHRPYTHYLREKQKEQ